MKAETVNPGDLDTDQPILSAEQIAKQADIAVKTWHGYVARGHAPKPDGHVGRTSVWLESTVIEWLESRRGTS